MPDLILLEDDVKIIMAEAIFEYFRPYSARPSQLKITSTIGIFLFLTPTISMSWHGAAGPFASSSNQISAMIGQLIEEKLDLPKKSLGVEVHAKRDTENSGRWIKRAKFDCVVIKDASPEVVALIERRTGTSRLSTTVAPQP